MIMNYAASKETKLTKDQNIEEAMKYFKLNKKNV